MTPSLPPAPIIAAAGAVTAGDVLADNSALMARIRGRADGRFTMWWWHGELYGKRPDEIGRRLLQIQGIGFNRITRLPDGSYESLMREAGYYCDVDSGLIVDRWTNPYTGAEVAPKHNRLNLRIVYERDGAVRAPPGPGPFYGRIGPAVVSGDRVWIHERLMAQFPPPPAGGGPAGDLFGAPMEVSTFTASLADIRNPALADVPATMSHSTIWSFYPWMGLLPASGYVITEILGRKLASVDELPAALRARIDRDTPDFLSREGPAV